MNFDSTMARVRLARLWALGARFGVEREAAPVYLDEIVSDRYALVHGMQVLRDELQFAGTQGDAGDLLACRADFTLPSVVTTLAHTNCGDRIQSGDTTRTYEQIVASRFATLSESGDLKSEGFFPTGGGTDDGATLAHVTVGHQLDELLRKWVYQGNASSFVLVCFDLRAHVGRLDEGPLPTFGRTREAPWREPRAACGAVVGALSSFNEQNAVHRRIRAHLGEKNFECLSTTPVLTAEGVDITSVVAAAIVCINGLRQTLAALTRELDSRGVGHATACLTVNRPSRDDTLIYLSRGTVFDGKVRLQGLGLDATRYGGQLVDDHGDRRLVLTYEGRTWAEGWAVQEVGYETPDERKATISIAAYREEDLAERTTEVAAPTPQQPVPPVEPPPAPPVAS
jgi:hypothetical protein